MKTGRIFFALTFLLLFALAAQGNPFRKEEMRFVTEKDGVVYSLFPGRTEIVEYPTDQGEKIHHLADHIATSTRQQATAGNEIALRMEDIVSGIDQTSNTIQEVTVRSKQIQQATECLRDLIAYFRFIR